jgi:hypothetical protein
VPGFVAPTVLAATGTMFSLSAYPSSTVNPSASKRSSSERGIGADPLIM